MKKLFRLLVTLAIVTLSGCSSLSAVSANDPYKGQEVATYLVGKHMSVADAEAKLSEAGFEVIAKYPSVKKGTTIVFTNEALKVEAAKPGRAYAAVLRLFVDDQEKMISIANPVYFGRAFMQDDYRYEVYAAQLEAIQTAFGELEESPDRFKYEKLSGYQFMIGMPYYEDSDKLGERGSSTAEVVAKAKEYKKGKEIIFELKLSESSTLLGLDLGKRTKKFVEKIGRQNAGILPWCVSVEDGQAAALNAKYYIAISYPLLDMSGFMGIATVPGAITKDLEKPFK